MKLTRRNFLFGTVAIVAGAALPAFPKAQEAEYVFSYYIRKAGDDWKRVVRPVSEAEAQALITGDTLATARRLGLPQLGQWDISHMYVGPAQTNLLRWSA